VPVQEYADNLAAMVASARAAGVPHVLLVTPPPVHDEGRVAHQLAVRGRVRVVAAGVHAALVADRVCLGGACCA
jgi:hypothetical protein